jgi:SAM-dependent methyltransferase
MNAAAGARLRSTCGRDIPLAVDRWLAEPALEEQRVLDLALPAVLDVGCGPARHTLALARRGVPSLGVDSSPGMARLARHRGAAVLRRSVFDRLPGEGAWGTILLLDGNIGIGGDPRTLLRRVRALLRRGGRVLVEVDPPGTGSVAVVARIEHDAGRSGWFRWAQVGADAIESLAAGAGLALEDVWTAGHRWFARIDAP